MYCFSPTSILSVAELFTTSKLITPLLSPAVLGSTATGLRTEFFLIPLTHVASLSYFVLRSWLTPRHRRFCGLRAFR
nr:MAG TPA: hypothetical protein [Caudoviricetes sp.]